MNEEPQQYLARRTVQKIKYDRKDISADLAPHLVSFSYTDHASGKADDLQVTLEDREGLWRSSWMPEKGAVLDATLIVKNWDKRGEEQELPLGLFEIDEIECTGPPFVATIKAVSVPESTSLRGEDKTRAWEKTSLAVVAKDITRRAGLELLYETDEDPKYDRTEQTEQSDLSFLRRLCTDAGLSIKVTSRQIVIFDNSKYEKMEPVMTITKGESRISKFSATSSMRDVYSSCKVKYHHAYKKEVLEYVYAPADRPKTGKTLVINDQVKTLAEAQKLAMKKLREKNKDEMKVTVTLPGSTILVGGVTVKLSGWGVFDGKYFTEQANHDVGGSGYTTKLDLRRVLEGY